MITPASDDDPTISFAQYRCAVFKNYVPIDNIELFSKELKDFPPRRVICGVSEISWLEQIIPPDSSIFEFFSSEQAVNILKECLGRNVAIRRMHSWTSVYRTGEYINKHRDACGDVQLVLSLKVGPPENGGWLNLDWRGYGKRVFLEPGDILCFSATDVEHSTEPLIQTAKNPNPERVVIVARYFLTLFSRTRLKFERVGQKLGVR